MAMMQPSLWSTANKPHASLILAVCPFLNSGHANPFLWLSQSVVGMLVYHVMV